MTMRRYPRNSAVLLALALAGLASGACGSEFDPASYLNDLRVLALRATPLEAGPGDTVTITPHVNVPSGQRLSQPSWSFCPFSAGSTQAYRCAVPQCETALPAESDGRVLADPWSLARQCLSRLTLPPAGGIPGELPPELPAYSEVIFRLQLATDGGQQREAVLRMPLYAAAVPEPRNRHPQILGVELDGQPLPPGGSAPGVAQDGQVRVRVRVDPGSLDDFVDSAGRQRTEEALVSFFATAGRFEYDRESGTDVTGTWTAEQLLEGQDRAAIHVVVRDLRGGQTHAGPFYVPIRR